MTEAQCQIQTSKRAKDDLKQFSGFILLVFMEEVEN